MSTKKVVLIDAAPLPIYSGLDNDFKKGKGQNEQPAQ